MGPSDRAEPDGVTGQDAAEESGSWAEFGGSGKRATAGGLTTWEASELIDLRWHWDEAYRIDWADGVYRAVRIGQPHAVLTADTCGELRQLVRDDYSDWQQSLQLQERSSL